MAAGKRVRRVRPEDRISPSCFLDLERLFQAKPDVVLRFFEQAHIGCLRELPSFVRLKHEQPQVAARIIFVAATLGVPEEC